MKTTVFIRSLHEEDKSSSLAKSVKELNDGKSSKDIFILDPNSFRQVPNSPFSYWISERIKKLFLDLPSFEGEDRTIKQGIATADDFRFVRTWWEVPADLILDANNKTQQDVENWTKEQQSEYQKWCNQRTYEGKHWVHFAKGGEYSPFYADIHLMVNWKNGGLELKTFSGSVIRNPDFYFRSGLTWPRRSFRMRSAPIPSGCIFSHAGMMAFLPTDQLSAYLALMGSLLFDYLIKLRSGSFGGSQFEVGLIQTQPVPQTNFQNNNLKDAGQIVWSINLDIASSNETSYAFTSPVCFKVAGKNLNDRSIMLTSINKRALNSLAVTQSNIDKIVFKLYGFTEENQEEILINCRPNVISYAYDESNLAFDEFYEKTVDNIQTITISFLVWCVGVIYSRFDIRTAIDSSILPKMASMFEPLPVCSPGMLFNIKGLPARPNSIVSEEWLRARPDANSLPPEGSVKNPTIRDEEYPIRISWQGILVDDAFAAEGNTHQEDILRRTREVIEVLWKERAPAIEQEACEILGVKSLRDYFRKPGGFFQDHLKRYSKSRRQAPIYWPLSSENGNYTLWIYYHRLTDQFLYTCANDYVNPRIEEVTRDIEQFQKRQLAGALKSADSLKQLEALQDFLIELKNFRDELLAVAQLPYKPDLNDGVIITAAPLWKLFRLPKWRKDLKACWEKLQAGDYDWAHLTLAIWPDRVRGKCVTDKSLAIAHDLEHLYDESRAPRRRRSAPIEEENEEENIEDEN